MANCLENSILCSTEALASKASIGSPAGLGPVCLSVHAGDGNFSARLQGTLDLAKLN